jgi:hypothetical protein
MFNPSHPTAPAIALTCLTVWVAGCTTSLRMQTSPDITTGADELVVTGGRGPVRSALVTEDFSIGPYRVEGVDRSWGRSTSKADGDVRNTVRTVETVTRTGYRYTTKSPGGQATEGQCTVRWEAAATTDKRIVEHTTTERSEALVCTCATGGAVEMARGRGDRAFTGAITRGASTYGLTEIFETRTGHTVWDGSVGFRVDREGENVAAIELLRPGRIWLKQRLDTPARDDLACVLAGLLLYEPPR